MDGFKYASSNFNNNELYESSKNEESSFALHSANKESTESLSKIIKKALIEQYEATNAAQLQDLAAADAVIVWSQGIKSLIYHILFMFLGPLCCLILLCFDNSNFINNLGFWPGSKSSRKFFILQTFSSLVFASSVYLPT